MKLRTSIWGKIYEVDVEQRSTSVFVAHVEYLGKSYSAQARSPSAAAKAVGEKARYATN